MTAVLMAIPIMGLLIAYDIWHCRRRSGGVGEWRSFLARTGSRLGS